MYENSYTFFYQRQCSEDAQVKQIVVPFSGNLPVMTLRPILAKLSKICEVHCINGGYPVDHDVPFEVTDSKTLSHPDLYDIVKHADLVINAPTSLYGDVERFILRNTSAPIFSFMCDVGGEFVYRKLNEREPAQKYFIADPRTFDFLIKKSVSPDSLVKAGNPHYDRALSSQKKQGCHILYMDVDFEVDFARGLLPCGPYDKEQYIREIQEQFPGCVMRLHPRSNKAHFREYERIDDTADPLESMSAASLVVSSYSTALFESYMMGIPAISYQPWETPIRQDVFRGRVPIISSLDDACDTVFCTESPDDLLFNPGTSRDFVVQYICDVLNIVP